MKWFRHKKKDRFVSFKAYLLLFASASEEERNTQSVAMKNLPKPETCCGKAVPEDFNSITYGQLDDLHDVPKGIEAIVNCCKVILGATEEQVLEERADRILAFVAFCNNEVDRINKLFKAIRPDYAPEEKMAGIEKLRFGSFGVLDWYARRMGISDQNEVRGIPWIRIFQCMKNDNEQAKYEKRLREIYRRRTKIKKK